MSVYECLLIHQLLMLKNKSTRILAFGQGALRDWRKLSIIWGYNIIAQKYIEPVIVRIALHHRTDRIQ